MRTFETYVCEICGKEFDNAYECEQCEDSHIINFSEKSNEDLIEYLNQLKESAYGYRIGKTTMGMHTVTFIKLVTESAKRLGEKNDWWKEADLLY